MARYRITFLEDSSYSNRKNIDVDNAVDEHDAIEIAIFSKKMNIDANVINVEFICE